MALNMAKYKFSRHFTIEEANSYISLIKPIMQEIRLLSSRLSEQGFDIYKGKYKPGFHPSTLDEFPPDFRKLVQLVQQINKEGIEIKGVEQGLVDFPAVRPSGEEVFLCWKLDEDQIEFWHPLRGGFSGREHIDEF